MQCGTGRIVEDRIQDDVNGADANDDAVEYVEAIFEVASQTKTNHFQEHFHYKKAVEDKIGFAFNKFFIFWDGVAIQGHDDGVEDDQKVYGGLEVVIADDCETEIFEL